MFPKDEDMQELLIELLVYKMSLEDCASVKRHLARKSYSPADKMAVAIDGLNTNKKHVFKRFRSGLKK